MKNKNIESIKINMGENSKFQDRLKIVGELMSSKSLSGALSHKSVPLYTIFKGDRLCIGYITDISSRITIRSNNSGTNRIFFFADVYITTKQDEILYSIKKNVGPHKQQYRLKFIVKDLLTTTESKPTVADNIMAGMIIELGV